MRDLKIGFVTSVRLGLSCMKSILKSGIKISLAITLPDNIAIKKSGRVFLDNICKKNRIPLIKVPKINSKNVIKIIKKNKIDWLFIIGWSQIASKNLINAPKLGSIGAHPTLLPKGRGRAPIPWAILKNLKKTGVTLFKLDEGVDSGPIIKQQIIKINKKENATNLYQKIELAHVTLIKKFIPNLIKGGFKLKEQNESLSSYWPKRKPEDSEINLSGSVFKAERLIRAVTKPYPGAFYYKKEKKIIIWKAHISKNKPNNKLFLSFKDGYLVCDTYQMVKKK